MRAPIKSGPPATGFSPMSIADIPTPKQFDELLQLLRDRNGFDFSGYKQASLARRIVLRMDEVGISDFGEYLSYLRNCPEEFRPLFNKILINVTGFFRNADSWRFLARRIVPQILKAKPNGEPIRAWSAGCASGEEAYSLAMVFADAVGEMDFNSRMVIFGTDVDEAALAEARNGIYPAKNVLAVPEGFRRKYFVSANGQFQFRKDFRRSVHFSRHDVIHDPPFSRLDLIVCRNTLIYFNTGAQKQIFARFHLALRDHGFLYLGESEIPSHQETLFDAVSCKHRIYAKRPSADWHGRLKILMQAGVYNETNQTQLEYMPSRGVPSTPSDRENPPCGPACIARQRVQPGARKAR